VKLNANRIAQWVAVVAAIVAIPFGVWAIHARAQQGKIAAIATVSAAASAHRCKLDDTEIGRLVTQYRDRNDVGWAETGSSVAKSIAKMFPAASS
jgi:hypothetical protein